MLSSFLFSLWRSGPNNTLHYNTIQYTTIQYNTIHYYTLLYNTIQYTTIQYNTIHYNTLQYNTLQYTTIQYTILQYTTIKSSSQVKSVLPPIPAIPPRYSCACLTGDAYIYSTPLPHTFPSIPPPTNSLVTAPLSQPGMALAHSARYKRLPCLEH